MHADFEKLSARERAAISVIMDLGGFDGDHHKQYALDQALRILTDCPIEKKEFTDYRGKKYTAAVLGESHLYKQLCIDHMAGEDGPDTYSEWEEGTPP